MLGGPLRSDRHPRTLDVAAVATATWIGLLYLLRSASGREGSHVAIGSVLTGAGLVLVLLAGWYFLRPFWLSAASWVDEAAREFTAHFEEVLVARPRGPVFLLSFIGLFAEVMLIRWHASLFQVFAFFKNVSLLACFLGLGLGLALEDRKRLLLPLVPLGLALQIIPLHLLQDSLGLNSPISEEHLMGLSGVTSFFELAYVLLFMSGIFLVTAFTLVPVGQALAWAMDRLEPLRGYGLNLSGSLAGVLAFGFLSELWTPPAVWMTVLLLSLSLSMGARRPLLLVSVPGLVMLAVLSYPLPDFLRFGGRLGVPVERQDLYTPYQIVSWASSETPFTLKVNHVYYQRILDLSRTSASNVLGSDPAARHYNLPFRLRERSKNVLVMGAGTGNDVAAALRNGVESVDAVEIDPAILSLGRKFHPEHPYSDPRVHVINDDARSFLRNSSRRYDLVLFGLLDSHTMLGSNSQVRLDSFMYTVEAFRDARAHLSPDGMVVLSFCVITRELGGKLYRMLDEAFDGRPPLVFLSGYDSGTLFVSGATSSIPNPGELASLRMRRYGEIYSNVDVSTDDWPFFYMPNRRYPLSSVALVACLVGTALLAMRVALPGQRVLDWHFFLLGTGFMLVETKGITELGLALGNTSRVLLTVISGVLLMAYLANVLAAHSPLSFRKLAYGGLAISLLAGYFLSPGRLALSPYLGVSISAILLVIPVLFSGLVFSISLRERGAVAGALASNLLGAIVGGLLEYNSMYFGFRILYLFALGLYALSALALTRRT
jgi:spermidine synthase